MVFIDRMRRADRCPVVLSAVAFVAFTATVLGMAAAPATVGDDLADRVRGANPDWTQTNAGDCSQVNVTTANNSNPPPPPGTGPYVTWDACTIANAACIACGTGQNKTTYELTPFVGTPSPVIIRQSQLVQCGTNNSGYGTIGSCQLNNSDNWVCAEPSAYYCSTQGAIWPPQGS